MGAVGIPRVASTQPWALECDPFGVKMCIPKFTHHAPTCTSLRHRPAHRCRRGQRRHRTRSGPRPRRPADFEAEWIAPGLFDLQINGCDGHSFNSDKLTIDDDPPCRVGVPAAWHHQPVPDAGNRLVRGHFPWSDDVAAGVRIRIRISPGPSAAFMSRGLTSPRRMGRAGPIRSGTSGLPMLDEFRRWQDAAGGRIRLMTSGSGAAGGDRLHRKADSRRRRRRHRAHGRKT